MRNHSVLRSVQRLRFIVVLLRRAALLASLFITMQSALAQGTAFTYQGRFNTNGTPYTGAAEFQFTLWYTPSGGSAVATNNPASIIATVANGLFTVTLDFGSDPFNGQPRFLQIEARTGISPFTTLSPRQPVTATPYALRALNLATNGLAAGTYSSAIAFNNGANSFNGTFTGNGAGLNNVNALTLGGVGAAGFWRTSGNAGTSPGANFLGTTDNQPLEIKVNGVRALRLEDNGDGSDGDPSSDGAPNIIGGSLRNAVAAGVVGATISGGGAANYDGFVRTNAVLADYGTVSGGLANRIASAAFAATIAGGFNNDFGTDSGYGAIGGGFNNNIAANSPYAIIAGGTSNDIGTNSPSSAIGGGLNNNVAANSTYATIAGGNSNDIGTNSDFGAIGGGNNNNISTASLYATITGGRENNIGTNSSSSAIGGGNNNNIAANSAFGTIAGGSGNDIGAGSGYSAIGGGEFNDIAANSLYVTIAGGILNNIGTNSESSAIGGGINNNIEANAFNSTIGGGSGNDIGADSYSSTIGGGINNIIAAASPYSTIGGGDDNNIADGSGSATIAGGFFNDIGATANYSTIGGGSHNTIADDASFATIPGGLNNTANGAYSFAAGYRAKANHRGSFVWADSSNFDFSSTVPNGFFVRAVGVKFVTAIDGSGGETAGVRLTSGSSAWTTLSDRNSKTNLAPVDARAVLERLAALPMQTWNWKAQEASIRHIGPMAQDFHAAFGVGEDERHITTVDADGVALAAIQGLNQKLTEELKRRDAENTELKERLEVLERIIRSQESE